MAEQQKMAGGGDGDELGQTLDGAENNGFNEMIKRRPSGVAAAIKSWISRSEGTNS